MSEVDKEDFKREYLPLVHSDSEGRDLTPPNHRQSTQDNPAVNNKSVISDANLGVPRDNKYSVVKQTEEQGDP